MFELAGLAAGIGGAIGKMISRGKANKELRRLEGEDPTYAANPEAAQRLSLAKNLLNARMPGAAQLERNIYTNQANQLGSFQRNATDSSQLLALGASTLGQSNQAFNQLGLEETQDYQRRYNNVVGAEEGVINEGDKVFQDTVRRYGDKVQSRGAQAANRAANWGDVSKLGFGLTDFGAAGGLGGGGGLFGKKGGSAGSTVGNAGAMYGRFNF